MSTANRKQDPREVAARAAAAQGPSNPRTALHQALTAQQATIAGLQRKAALQDVLIDYIAGLAGLKDHVASIRKRADAENPAQPVPNPASEQAFETTEQAVIPEAHDDVRNPGLTPGSVNHVPAETTDVALAPGATLPTAPFNDLQNVQAPVAGTETQLPLDQTRIETDVRVGDPMNPEVAYPWGISQNQSNGGSAKAASVSPTDRAFSAVHLARLRKAAGVTEENDLVLGQKIASSSATDADIAAEIATLSAVQKAASRQQAQGRPAGVVPQRTASVAGGVARTAPSLVNGNGGNGLSALAGSTTVEADMADSDVFL